MTSGDKVILISFIMGAVLIALYIANAIVTPSWAFEITTDKPVYNLGENVQVTVTLRNKGYISQSFTAAIDDPVLVLVEYVNPNNPTVAYDVWGTPYQESESTFTVSPDQPLIRTCSWNQTNVVNPQFWDTTYRAGTYCIKAFIPEKREGFSISDSHALFLAWVYINVTAT